MLPHGDTLALGASGPPIDEPALLDGLAGELVEDPEAFLARRCDTPNGSPIHPSVVLRSLLTGHVRGVVLDSRRVVIDDGTRQRRFTGLARPSRDAARQDLRSCTLPAAWSQVDHDHEWHHGGWAARSRAELDRILRIEFPGPVVDSFVGDHDAASLTWRFAVYEWRP